MTIEQAMDVAIGHFQAGRLAEAEKLYRQILTAQPDRPDTLHALGLLLGQSGQLDTAVELIRRAVTIAPEYAAAYSNLAIALLHSGKPAEAIEALRRLIELRPDAADAHHKLGQTLLQTGQSDDAITSLRTAIALQPNVAETHFDLGNALTNKGRLDDALSAFARAVEFKPDFALAQNNLAMALNEQGRTDEAMGCFDKAVELEPDDPTYASNRIYTSMFQPGRDSKGILAAQMSWNQHYARPLRKYILPHTNDRSPERRLRIGYVSPDFRRHVIGRNMLPLLREHDREHFEIFCYSNLARPDALTQRFRSLANGWRDIAGMDDSATAQMIRDDRIDVLIDLALHMEGNRLLVFARKPAPVQGTFAGYPGGTGLDTIDFRLTDPHLDPPGQTDNDYVEQSIRLPSFWCFDPEAMTTDDTGLIETEPVGPLPAMSAGHITFGCLNNFCKVSPGTLQLWASAMRAVSGSRLLLLAPPGAARQRRARYDGSGRHRTTSRGILRLCSATKRISAALPPHRPGIGHAALQRPHDEPGFAVDGCTGCDAAGHHSGGPRRLEPVEQPGTAPVRGHR